MPPKRARNVDASKQPLNEQHVSSTVEDGASGVEAELPSKRPTRRAQKPAVVESPVVVAKPARGRAKKENASPVPVAKSKSAPKSRNAQKTNKTNGNEANTDVNGDEKASKSTASTKPLLKSNAAKVAAEPSTSKNVKDNEKEKAETPKKEPKGRKPSAKATKTTAAKAFATKTPEPVIEPEEEASTSKRKKTTAKSAVKENLVEKEEAPRSKRGKTTAKPAANENTENAKPIVKAKRGKIVEDVEEENGDDGVDDIDGGILAKGGSKKKGESSSKRSAKKSKKDAQSEDDAEEHPSSDEGGVTKRKKPAAKSADKAEKPKLNSVATDYTAIKFDDTKEHTLKICSWNVAGLRALVSKSGQEYFEHERPDIICLQEIKCIQDEVPEQVRLKDYHPYWCSTPGGRGGVALLTRKMPYNVDFNLGDAEMDEEGRIITADYTKFFLVCVYVPNAGRKLVNLERRLRWNKLFEDHVKKLKERKPVIICGDMNVAHNEIDLANPKTNTKNAGFSKEERAGMDDLLGFGFIDTFRHLYPNRDKAYTFWTYMQQARLKNVGWRLDYSIVSENLADKVVDSFMRDQVLGSDHCPIVLLLNI